MNFEVRKQTNESSTSRALVPLTLQGTASLRPSILPNAAFITQLAANRNGFSQYRAKRREQPEIGAQRYRTTVSGAMAYRPLGTKLNYCA